MHGAKTDYVLIELWRPLWFRANFWNDSIDWMGFLDIKRKLKSSIWSDKNIFTVKSSKDQNLKTESRKKWFSHSTARINMNNMCVKSSWWVEEEGYSCLPHFKFFCVLHGRSLSSEATRVSAERAWYTVSKKGRDYAEVWKIMGTKTLKKLSIAQSEYGFNFEINQVFRSFLLSPPLSVCFSRFHFIFISLSLSLFFKLFRSF